MARPTTTGSGQWSQGDNHDGLSLEREFTFRQASAVWKDRKSGACWRLRRNALPQQAFTTVEDLLGKRRTLACRHPEPKLEGIMVRMPRPRPGVRSVPLAPIARYHGMMN